MNFRRKGKSWSSDMAYGGPRISPFAMSISKWAMTLSFSCWSNQRGAGEIGWKKGLSGRRRRGEADFVRNGSETHLKPLV